MGAVADAFARIFAGPAGNGTNPADGSPYSPSTTDAGALGSIIENAYPGPVDLAGEINRAESAEAAEAKTRATADAAEAKSRGDADTALGGRVDQEIKDRTAAVDGVQRAVDAEAGRAGKAETAAAEALRQEVEKREAGDAGLSGRADAVDRAIVLLQQDGATQRDLLTTKFGALSTALGTAALSSPDRPGDNPFLFTSSLFGLGPACPPIVSSGVVGGAYGQAYRVTGAATVARRAPLWLEPGRVHALRFAYARVSRPADPDDDAIRCGIACLDAAGRLLGTLVVDDAASVAPTSGLHVVSARFPSQPSDSVTLTPPAGTVLWRPFVETFGLDGVTDLVLEAETDVTDAGAYSPDVSDIQNKVTALQTALAALSPLAAGTPGGLATVDPSTGNVQQLPMLRSAWLLAAAQIVPGALAVLDNAISVQGDDTLTILHRSPYVVPGDAWSTFAEATLGLTDAQVATILAAIGSPGQRAGTVLPNPVFDLGVTTSHVLEAALARFAGIAGASMKAFRTSVGDEDTPGYYVLWSERSAPVGGALYGLLLAYLIAPVPDGPGLSQQAAIAQLTAIWTAAASVTP